MCVEEADVQANMEEANCEGQLKANVNVSLATRLSSILIRVRRESVGLSM
jgi:hypothetical protein